MAQHKSEVRSQLPGFKNPPWCQTWEPNIWCGGPSHFSWLRSFVWQINNSRLTSWSCYSCRLIKSKNRSLNHLFSYNCEDVFKYRLDQTDQLETGIFTTLLLFSILQEWCIATFAFTESVKMLQFSVLRVFFPPSKAIVSSELMLCGWQLQRSTLMACSSFTLQGPHQHKRPLGE